MCDLKPNSMHGFRMIRGVIHRLHELEELLNPQISYQESPEHEAVGDPYEIPQDQLKGFEEHPFSNLGDFSKQVLWPISIVESRGYGQTGQANQT